jgi:hypothetical protein
MIKIFNTTLCCIDCDNYWLSLRAIRYSSTLCHFDRVLFLTDSNFVLENAEVIKIPSIQSKEQYSLFVIKELSNYIDTDFVLLIQYDGFIVNPGAWIDEFQQYDYIGAKWRYTDGLNVGNGGFSLRSKRLLQALSGGDFFVERNSVKKGEDDFICRVSRRLLENKYNIVFAPETVADKFSYEYIAPPAPTFGFHGLFNIWHYIKEEELENFVDQLSPKTLITVHALKLGIIYHKMSHFRLAEVIYRKILYYWPDNSAVLMLLEMANKSIIPDIPV